MTNNLMADDWVPAACTLPTVDQPLRRAEFDDLFANDVLTVDQTLPAEVRFELRADPDVAGRAASLAARETGCCSFFTFDLTISDGSVTLTVSTDESHTEVLTALEQRARDLVSDSRS